jgi:ABC-type dipeptide/oligopeptide/nickel transport system ATPase subunit
MASILVVASIEVVDPHAVVTSQDGVTDESQSPSVRLLVVDDQALMPDRSRLPPEPRTGNNRGGDGIKWRTSCQPGNCPRAGCDLDGCAYAGNRWGGGDGSDPARFPQHEDFDRLRHLTSMPSYLGLVGLGDKADRGVRGFSGGERQRLGIAQAQVRAEATFVDGSNIERKDQQDAA